jgi:predicted DNA-binding ribbon-helix-helix protein
MDAVSPGVPLPLVGRGRGGGRSASAMADVMTRDLKRSLTIAGHRTSLSLEPEFWEALRKAAAVRGVTPAALVSEIDQTRGSRNLSSAVRVWILADLLRRG